MPADNFFTLPLHTPSLDEAVLEDRNRRPSDPQAGITGNVQYIPVETVLFGDGSVSVSLHELQDGFNVELIEQSTAIIPPPNNKLIARGYLTNGRASVEIPGAEISFERRASIYMSRTNTPGDAAGRAIRLIRDQYKRVYGESASPRTLKLVGEMVFTQYMLLSQL